MKGLLALALMVALLAIGNTAAAGPLGVSMGDPLKPDEGWNQGGFGAESKEYKGTFPFYELSVEGTRDGGACAVMAVGWKEARETYKNLRERLSRKYGEPSSEGQHDAGWRLRGNPDKISSIALWFKSSLFSTVHLQYRFENHLQCQNAKETEL